MTKSSNLSEKNPKRDVFDLMFDAIEHDVENRLKNGIVEKEIEPLIELANEQPKHAYSVQYVVSQFKLAFRYNDPIFSYLDSAEKRVSIPLNSKLTNMTRYLFSNLSLKHPNNSVFFLVYSGDLVDMNFIPEIARGSVKTKKRAQIRYSYRVSDSTTTTSGVSIVDCYYKPTITDLISKMEEPPYSGMKGVVEFIEELRSMEEEAFNWHFTNDLAIE